MSTLVVCLPDRPRAKLEIQHMKTNRSLLRSGRQPTGKTGPLTGQSARRQQMEAAS